PGYGQFSGRIVPTGDLEYVPLTKREVTEQAVFGELTYRFAERRQAALGARLFEYDDYLAGSFDAPLDSYFGEPQINDASGDGMLGKLNVAYDLSRASLAYLTV